MNNRIDLSHLMKDSMLNSDKKPIMENNLYVTKNHADIKQGAKKGEYFYIKGVEKIQVWPYKTLYAKTKSRNKIKIENDLSGNPPQKKPRTQSRFTEQTNKNVGKSTEKITTTIKADCVVDENMNPIMIDGSRVTVNHPEIKLGEKLNHYYYNGNRVWRYKSLWLEKKLEKTKNLVDQEKPSVITLQDSKANPSSNEQITTAEKVETPLHSELQKEEKVESQSELQEEPKRNSGYINNSYFKFKPSNDEMLSWLNAELMNFKK